MHQAAASGYERGASTYRTVRPSYHRDLVDRVVERYCDGMVVELGAGTGILTRALIDRGAEVIAVEPVDAMRSALLADHPEVDVRDGTAEAIPVGDGMAAAVVIGQSFHWFRHGEALYEAARVLQPGGHLVTMWNVRDESVPWVAAYTSVVDRYEADTPRYRTMAWRQAIDEDPRFAFVEEWAVDNPQPSDPDKVVARALSTSFIATLGPAEQRQVSKELRTIVAPLGDRFDYPYRSELQAWRLRTRDRSDVRDPAA